MKCLLHEVSPLCMFVCLCLHLQAHMLVCRALSNMLLLPWPNLPENEQQWQTRSSNHGSLLAALTREYRILRGTVNITPRQPDLNNSRFLSIFLSFFFFFLFCFVTSSLFLSICWCLFTLCQPLSLPFFCAPVKPADRDWASFSVDLLAITLPEKQTWYRWKCRG